MKDYDEFEVDSLGGVFGGSMGKPAQRPVPESPVSENDRGVPAMPTVEAAHQAPEESGSGSPSGPSWSAAPAYVAPSHSGDYDYDDEETIVLPKSKAAASWGYVFLGSIAVFIFSVIGMLLMGEGTHHGFIPTIITVLFFGSIPLFLISGAATVITFVIALYKAVMEQRY